jgi:uncharacterized protein YqeY
MAKTTIEKIEGIDAEMQQLANQRKTLIQQYKEQERKNRTRRLCKRAGLMESMLPDTIQLTDDQFKTFLEAALLSDYSRRMLERLTTQNTGTSAPQSAGTVAAANNVSTPKPDDTARKSGTDEGENVGNGEETTSVA